MLSNRIDSSFVAFRQLKFLAANVFCLAAVDIESD